MKPKPKYKCDCFVCHNYKQIKAIERKLSFLDEQLFVEICNRMLDAEMELDYLKYVKKGKLK